MKYAGLTTRIFVGMLIGIVFGLIMNNIPSGYVKDTLFLDGLLAVVGSGFIRLLMMLIVPVVFFSLACGTASLEDVRTLGRIGSKTVGFYLTTTAIAVTIALILANVISPGAGVDTSKILVSEPKISEQVPLVEVFLNILPQNVFNALSTGNMLQIIVFAIFIGLAVSVAGDKCGMIGKSFSQFNELFLTLTSMIMNLAPYGVFALVTRTFAKMGYSAMMPLAKYIFSVLLGLIIHAFFVYGGMLKVFTRLSILTFIKKVTPIITVIFSTASSLATLPVTLDVVEKRLGVSNRICSFTIPLGATVNMDGTAIMQGVASVFVAQLYGITLTTGAYLTIIVTATLASIGTVGIPGSGLIMLSMVLTSVGLPIEGIAMIMGIDRFLDMCRSVINIMGDVVCTLIIAKSENEFDQKVFDDVTISN
ncbi:MAG: dicarboxylate/amino acid:cation symporter [Synergistaceae bacterium]|nr:dicarboxylate/amino acid:cation symporter [Synergistaceae bacterium]